MVDAPLTTVNAMELHPSFTLTGCVVKRLGDSDGLDVFTALDASLIAERTLSFATAVAGMSNATLHLIWGVRSEDARSAAEAVIEIISARLFGHVRLSTRVAVGRSEDLVVRAARHAATGVIVALAEDQPSTTDLAQLFLTQTRASVLVVPDRVEQPWPTRQDLRILVPLDGTATAEALLLTVDLPLASIQDRELVLLRVVVDGNVEHLRQARRYIDSLVDRVIDGCPRVAGVTVLGDAATMICAVARAQAAELIVLTAAQPGLDQQVAVGPVAMGVLRHACVPVLLVRPPPQIAC